MIASRKRRRLAGRVIGATVAASIILFLALSVVAGAIYDH